MPELLRGRTADIPHFGWLNSWTSRRAKCSMAGPRPRIHRATPIDTNLRDLDQPPTGSILISERSRMQTHKHLKECTPARAAQPLGRPTL